jgi:4-carboxymuconolactone decarboxylase
MARLTDPLDSLDPAAQQIYDKIRRKRGRLRGPYAPLMHHPPLAERVGDLGEVLRFNGALLADVRELAILVTARAVNQPYEWVMHAPVARGAGLPAEVIELVRRRGDLATLPPRYARAARVVQHVLAFEPLPQPLQDEVQADLGLPGLLELVALPGFYRLIGGVLAAFEVPLPEGERPPF